MATVGYARVSSMGQSLDVQLDQALAWVREGDTLVVTRLDRLARSIIDLHHIIGQLTAKGVGFRCLHQSALDFAPGADQDAMGKLVRSMLGAFAEFELDVRKARQMEGIQKAKAAGVYKGRPAKIDATAIAELKAGGLGATEIAKRLGIGRASVYRLENSGAIAYTG
jgi:DNA invertase Pin-like site-specific DNA recombinase